VKHPVFVKHIHYQRIFSIKLSLLGFVLHYVDGTIIIFQSTDKKAIQRSHSPNNHCVHFLFISASLLLILIYLLAAIGFKPSSSCTVHIYTQTIHRTTQLTTFVGRLSWIRTQSGQTKINDELPT